MSTKGVIWCDRQPCGLWRDMETRQGRCEGIVQFGTKNSRVEFFVRESNHHPGSPVSPGQLVAVWWLWWIKWLFLTRLKSVFSEITFDAVCLVDPHAVACALTAEMK